MFGLRRRFVKNGDVEEYASKLQDLEQRYEAFTLAIRTLLVFLKDFSMDINEIDAAGFRSALDRFGEEFFEETSAKRIHRRFDREKQTIAGYIEDQKTYLEELEKIQRWEEN